MDKRIEIVEDINGVIDADKIYRVRIDRAEVEAAKAEIARIELENADYLAKIEANKARIEAIKAEIAEAEEIIAIADQKKASEETNEEEVVKSVETDEPVENAQM